MNTDVVARIVKAAVAVLAIAGINVTPENSNAICEGALAVYAVAALIQAKFAK